MCSTCPRRDVRGRFLTVIIAFDIVVFLFAISVHESSHAWMANRLGDPTARMLGRISLNPIRHIDIPGWMAVPGWQEPAVERRQAAATDNSMASGHRRSRGKEGARPGPGLTRAERGNPARVRQAGTGMCRPGGRPIVRGAETRWRDRVPRKRTPAAERQQESECRRAGSPPGRYSYNWPDTSVVLGPARALTWAGEPLRRSGRKCRN